MKSKVKIMPEKTDGMVYQKTNEDFNREKPSNIDPVQTEATQIQIEKEILNNKKTTSKK